MKSNGVSSHQVLNYNAILQQEEEGGYSVWIPDLPGCASQGETIQEALKNIQEAAELYLEDSKLENYLPNSKPQFFLPVQVNYA